MVGSYEYGLKFEDLKPGQVRKIIDKAIEAAIPKEVYTGSFHLTKMKAPLLESCYDIGFHASKKSLGLYIQLLPNIQGENQMKYKTPGVTWVIFINTLYGGQTTPNPNASYVKKILDHIDADYILLKTYSELEERL